WRWPCRSGSSGGLPRSCRSSAPQLSPPAGPRGSVLYRTRIRGALQQPGYLGFFALETQPALPTSLGDRHPVPEQSGQGGGVGFQPEQGVVSLAAVDVD